MTTTSKEYAEALFELAVQAGLTKETSDGVETVISALMQTPEYRAMLSSPAIGKQARLDALDSAFRGKVPDVLLGVLKMMVSRGHIQALDQMIQDYNELNRQFHGEIIAQVISAIPLREPEMTALQTKLENRLQRKVILRCTVNPALIGGIRVEADGRVMDGSLRNKLDQIKDVMNA